MMALMKISWTDKTIWVTSIKVIYKNFLRTKKICSIKSLVNDIQGGYSLYEN